MTTRYRQYIVTFETVTGLITGYLIIEEFKQYVDTDSSDVNVDKKSAAIVFVSTMAEAEVLASCDAVKKTLEKALDGRLIYKISAIGL